MYIYIALFLFVSRSALHSKHLYRLLSQYSSQFHCLDLSIDCRNERINIQMYGTRKKHKMTYQYFCIYLQSPVNLQYKMNPVNTASWNILQNIPSKYRGMIYIPHLNPYKITCNIPFQYRLDLRMEQVFP